MMYTRFCTSVANSNTARAGPAGHQHQMLTQREYHSYHNLCNQDIGAAQMPHAQQYLVGVWMLETAMGGIVLSQELEVGEQGTRKSPQGAHTATCLIVAEA